MSTQAGDVRVGVDIGGTFTDIAVQIGGRFCHHQGPDDAAGARAGRHAGHRRGARRGGRRAGRRRPRDPRHDARDQCADRAQGRAHGDDHHRGPSRHAGDGLRGPLLRIRCVHRKARAADPARPALHRARAHERQGRGAARRSTRRRWRRWCRSCSSCKSRASRSACCMPMPIPTTNGGCATSSRSGCREFPISLSSEVCAEVREYERFSTTACNAYVQPLMAGYLDRLSRQLKRDRPRLPALSDAVGRRADDARDGDALSRSAWSNRVRPAAPSWPRASPPNAICRACCRSTWAAPPPRSA